MQCIEQPELPWSDVVFSFARTGDRRRNRRLADIASSIQRTESVQATRFSNNQGDLKAAYRCLATRHYEPERITDASAACALTQAEKLGLEYLVVPVDGSSLHFTDTTNSKGLGFIGRRRSTRGLHVYTALLLSLSGVVLGVGHQRYWTRKRRSTRKSDKKDRRPFQEKETYNWVIAFEDVQRLREDYASETKLWFQCDRGSDSADVIDSALKGGDLFTVRSAYNRRIRSPTAEQRYLHTWLAAQPRQALLEVPVRRSPGRQARTARCELRFGEVEIRFNATGKETRWLRMNAVMLSETASTRPKKGKKRGLNWVLLTNHKIEDVEDAMKVLSTYKLRWRVEEFHEVWKGKAIQIEQSQLRDAERLERLSRIGAIVAARNLQLTYESREKPELAASERFSDMELRLLKAAAVKNRWPERELKLEAISYVRAVAWVARLGGYIGKSSGGPPGKITVGRGLERLEKWIEGVRVFGGLPDSN